MGERLICIQEVRSSILLGSTITFLITNLLVIFRSSWLESGMKICAITMVYQDYWALSQWYAHYSRHLGSEHLYIVSHGYDAKIWKICPKANVIAIPRDDLANFDTARGQMLNSFQDGLAVVYDWVIRTDADELVFFDPAKFSGFDAVFDSIGDQDYVFALGMNVVQDKAVFTGHYSKAWAVKRGSHLVRHGVYARRRRLNRGELVLPIGVYLMHLKYTNVDALALANRVRLKVTQHDGEGLPGRAWAKPTKDAESFFDRFEKLQQVGWEDAVKDAYNKVTSDPVRDREQHVLRAKSIRFEQRTTLPDWFKLYGLDP